ncbi:MAG TPA: ABC transporter ATP-binding protein [Bacteroidales bacterium]|nr:ABC transporter ATP-binding protein [Bacteroidales bacterium]
MMDENIAIYISGLSKRYPRVQKKFGISIGERIRDFFMKNKHFRENDYFYALHDINLSINKGESVGIIGRNGAGKSTLLKILAEVVEPTEGVIEINGTVASVLEIGMGFHPELTGRENVYLSGTMLGIPRSIIAERFNEIVEFAGVHDFIDTPVKHFSSGMYLRLAFSVVVNVDADILLFDEVLSVGDSEFHMKIFQKINELKQQGKTILLVSHNIHDIGKFCERTVFLSKGCVANSGATGSVITDYYDDIFEFLYSEGEKKLLSKSRVVSNNISGLNKGIENEYISVASPRVYAKGKSPDDDIFSSDDLVFELNFENKNDGQLVDIAWSLSQYDNIFMIFTALNKGKNNLDKGKYFISGFLPANILNDSHFRVDVRIVVSCAAEPERVVFYANIPDAAAFRIHGDFPAHEKRFFGPLFLRTNWNFSVATESAEDKQNMSDQHMEK